jgi:predicted adenine nucleotide alpha hydrolase (AANH) superfamily ATPase
MSPERILLHICCAPCATTVVRRLQAAGFGVHGYFYNPNVQPEKEYFQRLLEAQRLCSTWQVPLEIGEYDWDRWQAEVRGLETEKEGGKRCDACFRFRLAATAEKAKELGIGAIATTLTISPRKRPEVINPIGRAVCEELGMRFHEADWKKQDGYKQSLDVCRELHIYRQRYCGCKYSLKEREEQEAQKAARLVAELATGEPAAPRRVTKAIKILAEKPADEKKSDVTVPEDTRAKWELSPLERKKKRDKKAKPWQEI